MTFIHFFPPVKVRSGTDTQEKGMGVLLVRTRHEKRIFEKDQGSASQGWHRETKAMPLARNTELECSRGLGG